MKERQIRNFIIAGVPKAGTTAVFEHLGKHSGVCGSNVKETMFFERHYTGDENQDAQNYEQYFKQVPAGPHVRMEASPSYIYDPEIPCRIKSMLSGAKLLFILRDPIDRVYSFYNFHRGRLEIPEEICFEEFVNLCIESPGNKSYPFPEYFVNAVRWGMYGKYLTRFFDEFPPKQLKVMFFEALKANAAQFVLELCDFLELDKGFYENYEFYTVNQTFAASNKALHKLAIFANSKLEPFLRQRTALKRPVVKIYKMLNESKAGYDSMPASIRKQLLEHYSDDRKVISRLMGFESPDERGGLPGKWLQC